MRSPIGTRWRPPPRIAGVPLAPGSPGPALQEHQASLFTGRCVCVFSCAAKAGGRQRGLQAARGQAHASGGAEARGRRDALPHRLQRAAGSLSLLAKGASPSPDALTPDPNSRGFKNQPDRGKPSARVVRGAEAQTVLPGAWGPGNSRPGIRGSSPRHPAPRTADRLLMSGVCNRWNGGPQHVSKNGGLECSQERDW